MAIIMLYPSCYYYCMCMMTAHCVSSCRCKIKSLLCCSTSTIPHYSTFRTCNEDCVLNGVHFTKDLTVIIPIHAIHHNPEHWEEPEMFNPDRYIIYTTTTIPLPPLSFFPVTTFHSHFCSEEIGLGDIEGLKQLTSTA